MKKKKNCLRVFGMLQHTYSYQSNLYGVGKKNGNELVKKKLQAKMTDIFFFTHQHFFLQHLFLQFYFSFFMQLNKLPEAVNFSNHKTNVDSWIYCGVTL